MSDRKCNYCIYVDILKSAKKEGKEVEKKRNPKYGGTDIFVNNKWECWFLFLPEYCRCQMPIWKVYTDTSEDKSDLVQADVLHHGNIGDIYFSTKVKEDEYTICAAYAPHEWDKIILIEFDQPQTKPKPKTKTKQETSPFN